MHIDPRIAALTEEIIIWRRDFHRHPEIGYEVHRTAAMVVEKLKSFGVDDVVAGIGRTGVVGVIHGRAAGAGRVVGLRADMDALPMQEETNLPHASRHENAMHACGHDGHTAMLLGAAKHLAATREFDGTVIVIFQPAEEAGGGAQAMVDDDMMERWGIQEVYGMHNMPGLAPGRFAIRSGSIMAAVDQFSILIEGCGSHAAKPHEGIDPVLVGAHVITALQAIASRMTDPLKSVVVSTTVFQAGHAFNIIPQRAKLVGTVRALDPEASLSVESRLRDIARNVATMFGAQAEVSYERYVPVTVNHARETAYASRAAIAVAGADNVDTNVEPTMAGEDFSFMLRTRPGSYIFIGNGDSAGLHHPAYDFNDAAIPAGIQFWTNLAQDRATG